MLDWNAVKIEYIMKGESYRSLAEKYGVNRKTIAEHAKAEKWQEERDQRQNAICALALDRLGTDESGRLHGLIDATAKAIDVTSAALSDRSQFNRYIVSEDKESREKLFDKVDTKSLKQLTGVLKDLSSLMREFYNIPTPIQAEHRRIAAERLELEKARLCEDETGETGVVLLPAVEVTEND